MEPTVILPPGRTPIQTNWIVLLIGGTSGAGKTHLAQQLAKHYEISHMQSDDLRIGLRTVTNRDAHPELFTFVDNQNYLMEFTQERFIEEQFKTYTTVSIAVDDIINKHVGFNEKIVIEGDSVIPSLLVKRNQDGIKAIFLYDDQENILERQTIRNRNKKRTQEKLEINSRFCYAYSEAIRKQAEEHGYLAMKASPIETLFERVIAVLESE